MPFNQIIDLDNAPEDAVAFAEAEMIGCTLTAAAGQEGAATLTVTAMLHLRMVRQVECYVVADAFSTQYSADVTYKTVTAEQLAETLNRTAEAAASGPLPDENAQIIGCLVTLHPLEWVAAEGGGVSLGGRRAPTCCA